MELPIGNIVTAVATVIAVVIANRLTFSRTNKERLWDFRRQAYGMILAELGAIEEIYLNIDEYIKVHGEEAYYQSEGMHQDSARIAEHLSKADKRFADDYLVLSAGFIRHYERMHADFRKIDPNVAGIEARKPLMVAIRKARPKLLSQARSEMKLPRWWWPF
jgi:hypothetical protein